MSIPRDEVFSKVREILVCALAVDEEEVVLGASLQEDLGAESIDRLDITFQLERAFNIEIRKADSIFDVIESVFMNPEWVNDITLNKKGLLELKSRMPYADLSVFGRNPTRKTFHSQTLTVGLIVDYLVWRTQ